MARSAVAPSHQRNAADLVEKLPAEPELLGNRRFRRKRRLEGVVADNAVAVLFQLRICRFDCKAEILVVDQVRDNSDIGKAQRGADQEFSVDLGFEMAKDLRPDLRQE